MKLLTCAIQDYFKAIQCLVVLLKCIKSSQKMPVSHTEMSKNLFKKNLSNDSSDSKIERIITCVERIHKKGSKSLRLNI